MQKYNIEHDNSNNVTELHKAIDTHQHHIQMDIYRFLFPGQITILLQCKENNKQRNRSTESNCITYMSFENAHRSTFKWIYTDSYFQSKLLDCYRARKSINNVTEVQKATAIHIWHLQMHTES